MEAKEAKDSILGAISPEADAEEQADMLDKKTTFFGSEVRSRLKNLGVVKATNDDRGRYGQIVKDIDDGITIRELINRVSKFS